MSAVSDLVSKYPNAKFLIYGDFNDLTMAPFNAVDGLTQLVTFPTRGDNTLDLVYTDIPEYADNPVMTWRSDHSSVEISN